MNIKQSLSLSLSLSFLIFSTFQVAVSHASSFYAMLNNGETTSYATWATTSPGVSGSGLWLQSTTNTSAVACSTTPPNDNYNYTKTNGTIPSPYPLHGTSASVTC